MLLILQAIMQSVGKEKKGVLVYMEILVQINTFAKIGITDLKWLKKMGGRDIEKKKKLLI